jgi:uncharacterized membrane protein
MKRNQVPEDGALLAVNVMLAAMLVLLVGGMIGLAVTGHFTEVITSLHRCQIYGECGSIPHWVVVIGPSALFVAVVLYLNFKAKK